MRRAVVTGVALLAPLLAGCTGPQLSPPQIVKIAVILPVSSPAGITDLDAIKLELANRPAAIANLQISLDIYDDGGAVSCAEDPATAASDASSAVSKAEDIAVIGACSSRGESAIMPVFNNAEMAAITGTASAGFIWSPAQASACGFDFTSLHPVGKPNSTFFLGAYDTGCPPAITDRFGTWYSCTAHLAPDVAWFQNTYTPVYGAPTGPWADLYWTATGIVLQVINNQWMAGRQLTRQTIRDGIAGIDYSSIIDRVAFDANGVNTSGQCEPPL